VRAESERPRNAAAPHEFEARPVREADLALRGAVDAIVPVEEGIQRRRVGEDLGSHRDQRSRIAKIGAVKLYLALLVAASAAAATSARQAPSTIDFQRDVQPIFRDHCIGEPFGSANVGATNLGEVGRRR